MILSQRQLEEIAASTTKDFNRFFFGDEADKPDRSALPTPIDQFAKNYLGLRVKLNKKSPTWFYGLGYWTRGNAEICLLAKRGKPKRRSAGVHQFIISPVEEHSKKPDVTRDKIIELAGDLTRVELFARQKAPGWDVWGNEVDSDLSLTPQETVSETR